MTWSNKTQLALRDWLAPDYVFNGNAHDDSRFYSFIFQVWFDEQKIWDEALAAEKMKRKIKDLHPNLDPVLINAFIKEKRSDGTLLLDFLSNAKDRGFHFK